MGTTFSGWLTDRWDPRQLLFAFSALRGLSLFFLPYVLGSSRVGLAGFAVVYGLDWRPRRPDDLGVGTAGRPGVPAAEPV